MALQSYLFFFEVYNRHLDPLEGTFYSYFESLNANSKLSLSDPH